jgi:hypothetical protein
VDALVNGLTFDTSHVVESTKYGNNAVAPEDDIFAAADGPEEEEGMAFMLWN